MVHKIVYIIKQYHPKLGTVALSVAMSLGMHGRFGTFFHEDNIIIQASYILVGVILYG